MLGLVVTLAISHDLIPKDAYLLGLIAIINRLGLRLLGRSSDLVIVRLYLRLALARGLGTGSLLSSWGPLIRRLWSSRGRCLSTGGRRSDVLLAQLLEMLPR
jgi:hypothetical protein